MGKRGPRPRPTKLKLLHGERSDRVNRNEPSPPAAPNPSRCPTHLTTQAKTVWRRLAPDLADRSLLTEWDRDAFAVFCESVVAYRAAIKLLDAGGLLVKGAKGNVVKNPAHQIVRDHATIIRAFAQEFGLTPSARSSISMPDEEYEDLNRLLS